MSEEGEWALLACGLLATLILLLYFRARAHAKHLHNHIDRKIDVVHQAVGDVKVAVEGSRQEAEEAAKERRAETGYLTAVVEGARKDSATAAEGIRTAQHASDAAAALRGDKSKDALKGFQLTIWRQWTEALKSKFGRSHDPEPPTPEGQ